MRINVLPSRSYGGPQKPVGRSVRTRLVSPVSPVQLALCCGSLILGIFSFAADTYTSLRVLTDALFLTNLLLCVLCVRELLDTKALGKTLLAGSCLVFFWLDAALLAHGPNLFAVPVDLSGLIGSFDRRDLQQGLFGVALFQMMLMVGYSLRLRLPAIVNGFRQRADSRLLASRILVCAFAACGLITTGIAYGFSLKSISMALIASRNSITSDWQDPGIWSNLAVLGMFGASRLLLDGLASNRGLRVWKILLGLLACSPFILGGTRHLVLFVVLPVLAALIIRTKTLNFGRTIGLCAAGIVVLMILQLEFAVRAKGWDNISDKIHAEDFLTNSNGQFLALLFALHLVPAEHDFFHELAEPYFLIHWVPRAIWPNKPVMAAWAFYDDAYTRGAQFNVTPSVIGQFYMNWGFLGVACIGIWLGVLARFADLIISLLDVTSQCSLMVVAGMLHAFVISSFRYYHPLYFTYFAFSVVLTIMITHRQKNPSRCRDGISPNSSVSSLVAVQL